MAWSGSAGITVRIYVQEDDGCLRKVFGVSSRVNDSCSEDNYYAPVAILDEKTDGYYAFVLPWTENRVWRYDKEEDWYESGTS